VIVEREIDLDLLAAGQLEEMVVEGPPVGRDGLPIPGSVQVLVACRGEGQEFADLGLGSFVLGAQRDEVARHRTEAGFVCVGVLDDQPRDPLGMPGGQPETDGRSEVEQGRQARHYAKTRARRAN
jgi:hypothetical protein